ncbi:MAG: hypothetical protein AAGF10_01215 [Verrucomicrobiota bacterium]
MNVFILCTGRCGSTTLIEACQHITNFTSAHESLAGWYADKRLAYPERHIEADNRLSWFLGRLDEAYGDRAYYVHLQREVDKVAASYTKRQFHGGIMPAYREGFFLGGVPEDVPHLDVAYDYCCTVNANIRHFLKDKPHRMDFQLEQADEDFRTFWDWIGAEGDLQHALQEFSIAHNRAQESGTQLRPERLPLRAVKKLGRAVVKLPEYLRNV